MLNLQLTRFLCTFDSASFESEAWLYILNKCLNFFSLLLSMHSKKMMSSSKCPLIGLINSIFVLSCWILSLFFSFLPFSCCVSCWFYFNIVRIILLVCAPQTKRIAPLSLKHLRQFVSYFIKKLNSQGSLRFLNLQSWELLFVFW